MRSHKQYGFAALELVLVIVILGIIAFVAWRVMDAQNTVDTAQVPQGTVISNTDVPVVSSSSDLDKLEKQMSDTNLDDNSDLTKLDEESTF